jgi:hypothetical protein
VSILSRARSPVLMPRGFKVVSYDFDLPVPLAFDSVKQPLDCRAGFPSFDGQTGSNP